MTRADWAISLRVSGPHDPCFWFANKIINLKCVDEKQFLQNDRRDRRDFFVSDYFVFRPW